MQREFTVACPEEETEELVEAAAYLDKQMRSISDGGQVLGIDRCAIMAGLNITHALLRLQKTVEEQDERGRMRHVLAAQVVQHRLRTFGGCDGEVQHLVGREVVVIQPDDAHVDSGAGEDQERRPDPRRSHCSLCPAYGRLLRSRFQRTALFNPGPLPRAASPRGPAPRSGSRSHEMGKRLLGIGER